MAKLTEQAVRIIQKMNLDEDLRQDLCVAWLESDEPEFEFVSDHHIAAFVGTIYNRLKNNRYNSNNNRKRLREENKDLIKSNFGMDSEGPDDAYSLVCAEEVTERIESLSPLLQETLQEVMIEGRTPDEIAERDNISADVVYKRVQRVKQTLRGEQ